ncbi:NAD(P)/FAD-dependent oxidoreductase [Candidatus Halobonum tyrrellensis]|uniref:4-hydroxybenzoate 3-monooxygenase n=1 Tax=Candidatus Halobonum tyrrellensis G22 TaxID=1324957 RepID=V4HG23_9EURY|nr:NAD(P)/FAD-dependent oxidoreductase [Candidatus Halobonum tyrrellensis]ESP89068.1 4-hydroxybenzoate 3-monooxygenase [Candidatus Halobonum tyrrellensis G22]
MQRVDVAIVGGGPAGSSAAHAAASRGADALVVEKGVPRADRDGLGPDSTDAAGILDYWVDIMGIHPDEFPDGVVQGTLDRAEFAGPTERCTMRSTGIDSSYDHFGYTMHRARFDDFLRERAESAGAGYRVGTGVRGVDLNFLDPGRVGGGDPRVTLRLADGEDVGAEFLVLADGPQRTVTNRVLDRLLPAGAKASERLASTRANHIAYQEYRRFPPEVYEEVSGGITFWWGLMPGHTAYPWVFPNADRICRVGLTMPIGMDLDEVDDRDAYALLRPEDERIPQGREYVRRLLEREYGDEYDVDSDFPLVEEAGKSKGTETYPISSTRPVESPASAGIAVTGGAMGATSSFHEGGDHVAVRTGAIAGELAARGDMSDYNRRWRDAIGTEVTRNVAMAEMCRGYGPDDWDRIFRAAREMLTDEGGVDMFDRTFAAGYEASKLLTAYRWHRLRLRGARYVQLRESEYVY